MISNTRVFGGMRLVKISKHYHKSSAVYSNVIRSTDYLGLNEEICSPREKNVDLFQQRTEKLASSLSSSTATPLEKFIPTTFGTIRLDNDNNVKFHGQFDELQNSEIFTLHDPDIKLNLSEDRTTRSSAAHVADVSSCSDKISPRKNKRGSLAESFNNEDVAENSVHDTAENPSRNRTGREQRGDVCRDQTTVTKSSIQYSPPLPHVEFPSSPGDNYNILPLDCENALDYSESENIREEDVASRIESEYSTSTDSETPGLLSSRRTGVANGANQPKVEPNVLLAGKKEARRSRSSRNESADSIDDPRSASSSRVPRSTHQSTPHSDSPSARPRSAVQEELNRSAVDVTEQIRQNQVESEAGKNRGKLMRAVIPALWKMPSFSVVDMIYNEMLLNRDDIVIINKPFGLPIHSTSKLYPHSLLGLLEQLSERLGCERLYTVHRLDRDTTGALMLAKTPAAARTVQQLLEKRCITKLYWALLRGQLKPEKGRVEIPLAAKFVASRGGGGGNESCERMMPCPVVRGSRVGRNAKEAITSFRSLASIPECTLAELTPLTGVRHQLRSHMGLCLDRPVLGDHKYSQWGRMVPQRLPSGVLRSFGLRQSEARHVPLHLHSRQLIITDLDVNVIAPVPKFFKSSMKKLKLKRIENS